MVRTNSGVHKQSYAKTEKTSIKHSKTCKHLLEKLIGVASACQCDSTGYQRLTRHHCVTFLVDKRDV